jgi:hypothetical protein
MALPLMTHSRGSKALVLALPHKSDDEVNKLKRDALAGSVEAAGTLQGNYGIFENYVEAIFWGMVAIENAQALASTNPDGYAHARYAHATWLAANPSHLFRARAKFWLEQVAKEGKASSKEARLLLKRLTTEPEGEPHPSEKWPKW